VWREIRSVVGPISDFEHLRSDVKTESGRLQFQFGSIGDSVSVNGTNAMRVLFAALFHPEEVLINVQQ